MKEIIKKYVTKNQNLQAVEDWSKVQGLQFPLALVDHSENYRPTGRKPNIYFLRIFYQIAKNEIKRKMSNVLS